MKKNLYKKIIDECSAYPSIERIILYLNNEPLTDPYIIERINYAKEKVPWASVHILTNGSLLTENLTDKLINSKLDWIGISFHGIKKETIETAMGINYKIALNRILNFIDKAKEKRDVKDFIMVTFLRHKHLTMEEKDETMKFWQNRDIERISYFDGPISRAGNVMSLPQVRHKNIEGCTTIWANEMIHIVENGDIVLCCMDWKREIILGNVKNQSIYTIWNSDSYSEIRDKRDGKTASGANFICKRCEAAIPQKILKNSPGVLNKDKKPDILLLICPTWGVNMPPLGISYLYSYLLRNGYKTIIYDINMEMFSETSYKNLWMMQNYRVWNNGTLFENNIIALFGEKIDFYVDKILSQDTRIIGFSVNAGNLLFSIELAKRIKEKDRNKIIIFGGPHSKWFKTDINYLEKYKDVYRGFSPGLVDIFVIGEGEKPLLKILDCFKNNAKINNIPNTILFKNNKYIFSGEENFIENLDNLPFPDFNWTDLIKYINLKLPILMSRGCIRQCAFCNDTFVSAKYRCRSAENVLEEIKLRLDKNKVNNFEFCDLMLNSNSTELDKMCELIIKEKIDIHWAGQAAIKKDMNQELLIKMKRAGCTAVTYGIESFSNRVLASMKKPYIYDDIERILRETKEADIPAYINIITGFPGEGEEEFNETAEGIKECSKYIRGISSLAPCLITLGSFLQLNLENYGIVFPNVDGYFTWYSKDGNNYGLRKKRAKTILSIVSRLNLPVGVVNLYDEQNDFKLNSLERKIENLEPKRDRHNIFKLSILSFLFSYTFFYITYFWLFKKLKRRSLLG